MNTCITELTEEMEKYREDTEEGRRHCSVSSLYFSKKLCALCDKLY